MLHQLSGSQLPGHFHLQVSTLLVLVRGLGWGRLTRPTAKGPSQTICRISQSVCSKSQRVHGKVSCIRRDSESRTPTPVLMRTYDRRPCFIHQVIIITGLNKLYDCMFSPWRWPQMPSGCKTSTQTQTQKFMIGKNSGCFVIWIEKIYTIMKNNIEDWNV